MATGPDHQNAGRLDPNSDQTASFSISVTPPPKDLDFASSDLKAAFKDKDFLPIGEAKRIPWGKFRSYYNSLGAFSICAKI